MADGDHDAAEQHRLALAQIAVRQIAAHQRRDVDQRHIGAIGVAGVAVGKEEMLRQRSEEHTSELQSLMRISYAVFCLKKKMTPPQYQYTKYNNLSNTEID